MWTKDTFLDSNLTLRRHLSFLSQLVSESLAFGELRYLVKTYLCIGDALGTYTLRVRSCGDEYNEGFTCIIESNKICILCTIAISRQCIQFYVFVSSKELRDNGPKFTWAPPRVEVVSGHSV